MNRAILLPVEYGFQRFLGMRAHKKTSSRQGMARINSYHRLRERKVRYTVAMMLSTSAAMI